MNTPRALMAPLLLAPVMALAQAAPLTVCMAEDNPPFSMARKGQVTGFDVKLAEAVARELGRELKLMPFEPEVEAATIPRILPQVDAAVINTNYALDAGLKPRTDALQLEGADSPYINYLVSRRENQNDPRIQALATALRSQAVKDFIAQKYEGAVIPAA